MNETESVTLSQIDAAKLYQYGIPIIDEDDLSAMKDTENEAMLEEIQAQN